VGLFTIAAAAAKSRFRTMKDMGKDMRSEEFFLKTQSDLL
jgi:hypothetical protein